MGPPPAPGRVARQSSVSSPAAKGGVPSRAPSGRLSLAPGKPPSRADSLRRPSGDSQTVGNDSSMADFADDTGMTSPPQSDAEILSPQPTSLALAKSNNTVEKLTAAVAPKATTTTRQAAAPTRGGPPSNAEVSNLRKTIMILERKVADSRGKLASLEQVKQERDKYQKIITKLQEKMQPQVAEINGLRKQLKEAEERFGKIEDLQAEHESEMENALLDREMAEERLEHVKLDFATAQERLEMLELENDVLRAEHEEAIQGITPEERASQGWLAKERENERLKEALGRFRDITREREEELVAQTVALEEELKDFGTVKDEFEESKEKLDKAEGIIEDLRQQLETALGAEDLIEDLTHQNMSLSEQIGELKVIVEDLEALKEINDELEVNHVQNEKEMQEEIDFKSAIISEQLRRAAQQDQAMEDMEYTLSRFRELVTNLQGDLEDIRASHAVTEVESEQLNSRSRAMMDLNMKLQISAAKAQVKTIDLELRRLDAQEAAQHLEIVTLFLPDTYKADQNSVLTLLRFRRLTFKANLLQGFIREKINGQPHPGHEDDVFYGCDALDKLTWVSSMCERFSTAMGHCSTDAFAKYESAVHELEPVERALNAWIDGLRKDELKEQKCAADLQRTIALLSHLGEVHFTDDLSAFADETFMQTLNMQSHLESATIAMTAMKTMVQRIVPAESDEDELAHHFLKRADLAIGQTRSAKMVAGKAVRALEDLKTRSLSLLPESREAFELGESATRDLATLARQIGLDLHALLTDEGRADPYTYVEVQNTIQKTTTAISSSSESDLFSTYLANLRVLMGQMNDLAALCSDLDQTQEFDVNPEPWIVKAQELRSQRIVPVDAEEDNRRLREECNDLRRTVAQREESFSTAQLKIETLESRMRDTQAKANRLGELEVDLDRARQKILGLKEDMDKQDRELRTLEAERDKWQKQAGQRAALAESSGGVGAKVGKERAVATAREIDALKNEITSLQAAVRFLREDNRRARTADQHKYDWLAEPLRKPQTLDQQRRALVSAEGRDVLGELVRMASSAKVYDLSTLPTDKLAWRRAKSTPQYHAAKQHEDYVAWKGWQEDVVRKSDRVLGKHRRGKLGRPGDALAKLQIRLPGPDGKMTLGTGNSVQIVGSAEWEDLQATKIEV